ncbi:MAG TPA: hypothetical protein DCE41_09655 [Cytophagales bacterium]|nr:hypothetical protein [Cytophagales bacterium]HAA18402.1 hypothetical protein [Cytophagales bacterium]HAP61451.1 hypothetical protein [Cytophagales bacterium]
MQSISYLRDNSLSNPISSRTLTWIMFGFYLISAFGNAVLRGQPDGDLTLHRLLFPIFFLWFFLERPKRAIQWILIFVLLLIYDAIISLAGRFHRFDLVFYIHTVFWLNHFLMIQWMIERVGIKRMTRFLEWVFWVTLGLAYVQMVTGGTYPNVQERLEVNIYFWNGNELAAALVAMLALIFFLYKGLLRWLAVGAVIPILMNTSTRFAMIGLFMLILFWLFSKIRIGRLRWLPLMFGLSVMIVLLVVFQDSVILSSRVEHLFVRPFTHIFTLDPLYNVGSVNNRINAIIHGIIELKRSYFFGIGAGNSIPMMTEIVVPGTEKYTAFSMHNFNMQVIVEWGFVGILLLFFFARKVWFAIYKHPSFRLMALVGFYVSLVASFSTSSGPWANYAVMTVFFISFFYFKSLKENYTA